MNVKITEHTPKPQYPVLKRNKTNGKIAYFESRYSGFLLNDNGCSGLLNACSDQWEPFSGVVTLSNDEGSSEVKSEPSGPFSVGDHVEIVGSVFNGLNGIIIAEVPNPYHENPSKIAYLVRFDKYLNLKYQDKNWTEKAVVFLPRALKSVTF